MGKCRVRPRHACVRCGLAATVVRGDGQEPLLRGPRAVHHRRCGREQQVSLTAHGTRSSSVFADETGVRIHVSHFPPGTSKWNKIEHRVFCHITQNSRGKSLRIFETIVDSVGNTHNDAGLRVRVGLDKSKYTKGLAATDAEMDALSLHRNAFDGDRNYELHPR